MGWGGSKKCKPIPTPPRGAGLKSRSIPAPSPLRDRENPHWMKRGGAGQAGQGKIAIPTLTQSCVCQGELIMSKQINVLGIYRQASIPWEMQCLSLSKTK